MKVLQRQRVDFRAHAIAQRLVDLLVLLHPGFPRKQRAHDHRLEVLTVIAQHLRVVAGQAVHDVVFQFMGSQHGGLSGGVVINNITLRCWPCLAN